MIVVYADEFKKQFRKLPERIQTTYRRQETILRYNPFDARLHAKPLKGYDGIFSFRVTREYRVLFQMSEHTIIICLTNGKIVYLVELNDTDRVYVSDLQGRQRKILFDKEPASEERGIGTVVFSPSGNQFITTFFNGESQDMAVYELGAEAGFGVKVPQGDWRFARWADEEHLVFDVFATDGTSQQQILPLTRLNP